MRHGMANKKLNRTSEHRKALLKNMLNSLIKYEQIVQDFDHTVTKLLSFLELEWSDNVKEFYKTAEKRGIINTPSYRQINQPLYKKSIGRWKNYENEFSEVKDILDKWTKIFNY